MTIAENTTHLLKEIATLARDAGRDPTEITLIAVTKNYPLEHVLPAYHSGCRHFGENRVQEALSKIEEAPSDLHWHLIGTLQKKKVPKVIGKFALIHSVDTPNLAQKISICSEEKGLITPILLQVNTSGEETKHGLSQDQWRQALDQIIPLPGIRLDGLMTMAPYTDDTDDIRACFKALRLFRDELQPTIPTLRHLSMGMSHDYPIAIAEGATLLRIGSALFGGTLTSLLS